MASTDPRTRQSTKPSTRSRRQPVVSEQPSISVLSELGVKVRDFGYENLLPPVPAVHLPLHHGHLSVPNGIHNVRAEEYKKEVHLPESTRKIQRTPTEPILDNGCVSPERQKIKRTNALLDLSSQSDLQPGVIQSASQPIQHGTSILSSNGSVQWLESSALTATGPSVLSSQINCITAPSELVFPNSQAPILSATAVSPISQFCNPNCPAIQGSSKQVSGSYAARTIPVSLPPVLYSVPPAQSTLQPSSSESFSHLPPSTSNESMFLCYNLRRNKRRAESPPLISPDEYHPPRKRIKTSIAGPGTAVKITTYGVSAE